MENTNQDAMLNQQDPTFSPETGGPVQTPDESTMMDEQYDPTDLSGDAQTMPSTPTDEQDQAAGRFGAASGSPNMEPDNHNWGNGDTLGNNDGTEPSPERTDEESI
ncbi:hypothetical protein GCM10027578_27870 [Spirosoma luteolum]